MSVYQKIPQRTDSLCAGLKQAITTSKMRINRGPVLDDGDGLCYRGEVHSPSESTEWPLHMRYRVDDIFRNPASDIEAGAGQQWTALA